MRPDKSGQNIEVLDENIRVYDHDGDLIRGGDDTPDEPEEIEESACEDVAFNFKDAIQSFHDEVLTRFMRKRC